jgi:hypothetical protein
MYHPETNTIDYTNEIPVKFLKECFEYNPETGILIWKERP